jgi:6-phosphofructokinase
VLSSRLGIAAVKKLADEDAGNMVGCCGDEICRVPLDEVVGEQRPLDSNLYRLAGILCALSD